MNPKIAGTLTEIPSLKARWEEPHLQRIGSMSEIVQTGGAKSGTKMDGNAGGDATEYMPMT